MLVCDNSSLYQELGSHDVELEQCRGREKVLRSKINELTSKLVSKFLHLRKAFVDYVLYVKTQVRIVFVFQNHHSSPFNTLSSWPSMTRWPMAI